MIISFDIRCNPLSRFTIDKYNKMSRFVSCIPLLVPASLFLVVYKNEESTPLIRPKRVYAPKAVLKFCSKKKEGTYYGNKYPPYLPTYLFNQFNFRSIFLISVKLYFL